MSSITRALKRGAALSLSLSLSLAVGFILETCLAAGCDPSKEPLEQTRGQLAKLTAERDQLKGQVDTMKVSLDTLKIDAEASRAKLAELQAKLTACATPPPAPPVAAPDKHAKGGKK